MASLLVVAGKSRGYYFPLEPRTIVIGRDEGCDIQVLDEAVSRRHVQIRFIKDSGSFHAADLDSANGLTVNGRRIAEETVLNDGDTIMIGKSKLFFTIKDFLDRDAALSHFKHRGEKGKATLMQ